VAVCHGSSRKSDGRADSGQPAERLDLDPLAAPAARRGALENALSEQAAWLTAPIQALRSKPLDRFDLVAANLLRAELMPIAELVAERVAPGGHLVLAGLLERDESAVLEVMERAGLRAGSRRIRTDDDGEAWLGLVLERV